MDIPITLVIKAPNQRVEDQTVECMLGWTVKKLKRHLETVYPNKPKEHHQKLIYSGKLLTDDVQLKDVLRQQEDAAHTVHLVCSSYSDISQSESQEHVSSSSRNPQESASTRDGAAALSSTSSQSNHVTGEGLRHRHQQNSVPDLAMPGATQPNNVSSGSTPLLQTSQMVMTPGTEMFYTQEQYMMMMQYYYQQQMAAAQYMQYYQTGAYPMPQITPTTTREEQHDQNQENHPPVGDDIGGGIMNAQGGMMDDDDEEFGQRDWLDYIHTLARFMVLVSIVYFYSNFTRFLLVFLFFFIIYLYQTGWFQLPRRVPENPQERHAQQQQQAQEQQAEVQQGREQNNLDQEQVNNTNTEGNTENTDVPPQVEHPRPGVLTIAWCFISTFFTSLIPQPPPAVNAN